ncbi:MAG: hypothetical protein WCD45_01620 [Gallionella sp.]
MSPLAMEKILSQTGSLLTAENRSCPVCKSAHLDRIHRRLIDRFISLFVSIKRYHCCACQWEGNLKIKQ